MFAIKTRGKMRFKKVLLISRNKNIQFGDYCIRGTRIPITSIRAAIKGGDSIEFVMKSYNLTREQVEAALNFRR